MGTGIDLYPHQANALEKMHNGCLLVGGVGTGKSRTALAYYYTKVCKGSLDPYSPMEKILPLYIITTARKRDTKDWEVECLPFLLPSEQNPVDIHIDSWNNIGKYKDVKNAFFIFDEQRVVSNGSWSNTFIKIARSNWWILLSATPGDTWMDYLAVFRANGFYKTKTEFINKHVVYNRFVKYPKIDRYINTIPLERYRRQITVRMHMERLTRINRKTIRTNYDKDLMLRVTKDRWNVFENTPIKNASEFCSIMRKISNTDPSKILELGKIVDMHHKLIIFYNFNYELELLRGFFKERKIPWKEWNGHIHEPIPNSDRWAYLVQYTAGAEGWNCVETDSMVFFSLNYSYKIMIQAEGRINRLNTEFVDLYYYRLVSDSQIDYAIQKALSSKKKFNEKGFAGLFDPFSES